MLRCERVEKVLRQVIDGLEDAAREISDRLEQGNDFSMERTNLAGRFLAYRRAKSFVEKVLDEEAKCRGNCACGIRKGC